VESEESFHHSVLDMDIQNTDLLIEQEKMVSMLSGTSREKLFETSKKSVLNSIREAAKEEERAMNMPVQMINH
jgi:hypothetical protein